MANSEIKKIKKRKHYNKNNNSDLISTQTNNNHKIINNNQTEQINKKIKKSTNQNSINENDNEKNVSPSPEPPQTRFSENSDSEDEITNKDFFNPHKAPCRDIHSAYVRVDYIDHGVYGSVHQGKNLKTGEIVALKKVKIKAAHRNGFPITALRETNLLLNLKHPNIVDVKEVVVDSYDNGVFMVMEYMEHDLKRVMKHFMNNPFSVSEVKCLIKQLLQGIAYMHENWVLHRDLKTSNLLYDNRGRLKICDFGMARKYGDPLKSYSPNVITLWYRAPELLLGEKTYGPAVDMWSAGAIMSELLLKKGLFEGSGEIEVIEKIFRALGTPNVSVWPGLRELPGFKLCVAKKFKPQIRSLMRPNGRMIISEMGMTLLKSLLAYNPKRRITAEKALQHPWFTEAPQPQTLELMPTFPSRMEVKNRQKKMNKKSKFSHFKSIKGT